MDLDQAFHSMPEGFDVWTHVCARPFQPPPDDSIIVLWTIGPVRDKDSSLLTQHNRPSWVPQERPQIKMQLTADQQVDLSISGQDKYGNSVPIGGDTVWVSSDESLVQVTTDPGDPTRATAVAVGPAGTAAVTVTNDVDRDGTGDFMGSLAIDVVAGNLAEIDIAAGTPTTKPDVPSPNPGPGPEPTPPTPTPDQPVQRPNQA